MDRALCRATTPAQPVPHACIFSQASQAQGQPHNCDPCLGKVQHIRRRQARTCRYCTESEYAVERQSSPRILNICTVVTNVQRPCLMMSVQGITLACLAVKGEAMLASPGFTMGTCALQQKPDLTREVHTWASVGAAQTAAAL